MSRKEQFFSLLKGDHQGALPFMPITMMYAADGIGRPYKEYATMASVQAEGQLALAEAFGTTHVSVISDPAVEAADLGATVMMPHDAPPAIREEQALLTDKTLLASLTPVAPEDGRRMANRLEALRLLKEKTGDDLVVEGWVEGPCAEAADLRGINHLMTDFFDDVPFVEDLMDFITDLGISFAEKQLDAGADLIGIGDAASSLIGPDLYEQVVLPRMIRSVDAVHRAGGLVRLHICGNTGPLLGLIAGLGVDMIDLDSMVSVAEARRALGETVALAGNLNPVSELKDSTPADILSRLEECRQDAGKRYIVGAGCEIPRGTPRRNLEALGEFARRTSMPE